MQAAFRVAIAVLVGVHAVAAALPFCDTLRSVDQPSHSNTIEKLGSHRGGVSPTRSLACMHDYCVDCESLAVR
jgi:hypothetical protein